MKEQLHTTKERSLKIIKAALKHPLTYGVIGISMVSWGAVDATITTPNKINRQLNEAFPLTASAEKVKEAQKDVLVFDRIIHGRVISGQTKIDTTEFSKQSRIAQAITIANEQELRDNLKEHLDSRATVRQISKAVGGMIFALGGGLAAISVSSLKRRQRINEARPERIANA